MVEHTEDKLRRALEPFANIALLHDVDRGPGFIPDMIDVPDLSITPADVRRAREALAATQEQHHD